MGKQSAEGREAGSGGDKVGNFPLCSKLPSLRKVMFMVKDIPMSQLGSAVVANWNLLKACRPWLTYDSVPAKPIHQLKLTVGGTWTPHRGVSMWL